MVLRWSRIEDETLLKSVKQSCRKYGKKMWVSIARMVGDKNVYQCRHRWRELLDRSVKKVNWSRKEDKKQLRKMAKFAKNYASAKKAAKRKARQLKLIEACRQLITLVREQRANQEDLA